jgi:hypothetical protein
MSLPKKLREEIRSVGLATVYFAAWFSVLMVLDSKSSRSWRLNQETRMDTLNIRKAAALFTLAALVLSGAVSTAVRAQSVEPAAKEIFRRMTDYLGSLHSFSLDTQNTLEVVLESRQKIQFDFSSSVVVERPNKVRAERTGDLVN